MSRGKPWSYKDDQRLRFMWGSQTIREIAKAMERSEIAVYARVKRLGMIRGCPRGYLYFTEAAERMGYCRTEFRKLLRWAGVDLRRALSVDTGAHRHRYIVEEFACLEAVEAWSKTETMSSAARRLGTDQMTLCRWLRKAGKSTVKFGPGRAAQRRVESAIVDEVAKAHRERIDSTESLREAILRTGVERHRLERWIVEAEIPRFKHGRQHRLVPADIDRVVAERLHG